MKETVRLFFFSILMLILTLSIDSCSNTATQQTSNWNLASIYNPLKSNLHPTYKIYHNAQNTSVLFFKLRTRELYFKLNPISNIEECSFTIRYLLQEIGKENNTLVDSNTYVYEFRISDVSDYYITQIPIKAIEGNSYRLKVTIRDNNKKAYNINYIEVEKRKDFAEQYFNITSTNGTPLFRNVLINSGAFRINHANPTSDKLYIKYYKNEFPAPKPIIASSSDETLYKKYDSLFVVKFEPSTALSLNYKGLYFMQFDTNSSEGVSILMLNKDYPKVEEPEGLLPPLSYITTDAEYKNILSQKNAKLAADRFWVKIGGNVGKGREMIRVFYNRVYYSNYYFTNTQSGWKTDRGMVYVVYGPPHKIKKTADTETWFYERKGDDKPISFNFVYAPTKYSLNKFVLQRSNSQEWHWTETIYSWTRGDIFLYD